MKQRDIGVRQIGDRRDGGTLHLSAALSEGGGQIGADGVLVADDEHPQRGGGKGGAGADDGQTQEVAKTG